METPGKDVSVEQARPNRAAAKGKNGAANGRRAEVRCFTVLEAFSQAVHAIGLDLDFSSVTSLNASFLQSTDKYLLLNVKDYTPEDPNNLLFLSDTCAFLYCKRPLSTEAFKPFEKVSTKQPYGATTVLALLALSKVAASYKERLDALIEALKRIEEQYDVKQYRELTLDFNRLYDRVEDIHEILIRLEERSIKEVETQLISFDYRVLLAESGGLLDRCRNRIAMVRDVARDHETQVANELNRRIERLNDVVKRLTAITIILMIPTLVASHFGMNFEYMPELSIRWVYPTVVGAQIASMAVLFAIFKKIGWL